MNIKSTLFHATIVLACSNFSISGYAQIPVKVNSFPISEVRLTTGPFKHAEDMDICYLLGLDADRLLAPYLKGAGLEPKAENYPNWENTGLDGHIGGHYLSALSYMYAATGNTRIKERLDYMLKELKRCQDAAGDGYLCGVPNGRKMWNEIKAGHIQASSFSLNGRWVPLYNIHKIYAGLRDAYLEGGSIEAKEILVKLTDWMLQLVKELTDAQIQDMLRSEQGGLNEVFADVAAITGNEKYLKLAHRFSDQKLLGPLLKQQDQLTGLHANTQIPKVIGYKRIADLEGDLSWDNATRFFWNTVVKNRSVSIGGNSVREHFHPGNDFSSMFHSEQGPETCNTYNMLRLTKMLYQTSGERQYIDFYERALYNHILSTQDPVQGGFVYFTPMRAGHYRVYSQPQTSFWCCVGTGMENHARYGEMIYGFRDNKLYVNLFIPSTLNWKEKGVQIEQQNNFPEEEGTTILITSATDSNFTLHFRCPEWVHQSEIHLTVNRKEVPLVIQDGYITLRNKWEKGDQIHLRLPMHLQAVTPPDKEQEYSFLYGPIVLAAEIGTQDQTGLFANESRGGHIAAGPQYPLSQMPVIVGTPDSILQHLVKQADKSLSFSLHGNIYPSRYEGLKLVPFYRLYECRYAIYFPLISKDKLKQQEENLARTEQSHAELERRTIDKVICGEQQPESDHFIKMWYSNTGVDQGIHWRATQGWFTYLFKNKEKTAKQIQVTFRPERNKDFRIWVNDEEIKRIKNQDSERKDIYFFALPESIIHTEQLEIKIAPADSKTTPHIYELRLLSPPSPL